MELKLDAKLLKACNGAFLFAIALIMMINSISWLIGLFMMFGACALCYAWYMDGMKDCKAATMAAFYVLFAIVFFAKKEVAYDPFFIGLWATLEGAILAFDGWKAKEEKADFWFVPACLGALAVVLGFVCCFVAPTVDWKLTGDFDVKFVCKVIVGGLAFLFISLAKLFPLCEQFLPKVALKK